MSMFSDDVFTFEAQAKQYPVLGIAGITYFPGKSEEFSDEVIDCLLARDDDGKLVGILNYYGKDFPPYQKAGDVNVFINPDIPERFTVRGHNINSAQGIVSALVDAAQKRFGGLSKGQVNLNGILGATKKWIGFLDDADEIEIDDPFNNALLGDLATDNGDDWVGTDFLHLEGAPNYGYEPFVMQSPVEALDMHLRQWQWSSTAAYTNMVGKFLKVYADGDYYKNYVKDIAKSISDVLDQAMTTYVSPDVADLVKQMGLAMPPDMLTQSDVPYPVGFIVLGKTWPYLNFDADHYVGTIPLRAIAWWEGPIRQPDGGPSKRGITMALFTDDDWRNTVSGQWFEGSQSNAPLWLVDMLAWTYDTMWGDVDPDQKTDQGHQAPHVGALRRMLLALWRFMGEEIVRTERPHLPRPARRRWEHAHKTNTPDDGCMVSIHLRKYAPKPSATKDEEREAAEIFWSHRWWVRGHLRYCRKCGIDHPKHKHEWVRPYLKPNDDTLPIVLKERLVSVDR